MSTVPIDASIVYPADGAMLASAPSLAIQATAGSLRGVVRVELWLNGHRWTSVAGAAIGSMGQPDPATYALVIPDGVPATRSST